METNESKQSFQEPTEKYVQPSFTHTSSYDIIFWLTVGASQLAGIAVVSLVSYWCVLSGGFAWLSDADKQFNFHPLLMILGLIFCYGDSILIYRVFHFLPKLVLKLLHAALHLSALVMSSVGLAAVFENHRRKKMSDMYSIHSWVGIITFGLFCLQYVVSFATFLFPGMPPRVRGIMMPFHTFFGFGIFCLAVAASLMGINEKLMWVPGGYSTLPKRAVIGNSLALCIVVFAFLVAYISTRSNYKRKPLPTD